MFRLKEKLRDNGWLPLATSGSRPSKSLLTIWKGLLIVREQLTFCAKCETIFSGNV